VYNKTTNEPIEASIIFEDLDSGDEFINIKSDAENGYYETILPIGYHYAFYAKAKNYISINENVSTASVKHNSVIEQDLYLVPLEVGGTVRLNNIFFETAKADLKEESAAELKRLIGLLNQITGLVVEIGGHTDSVGSDVYNLNLSNLRASAVRDYLLEHSIDTARVVSKGYGETVPVDTNDTDEGRQQNRRVEFKILGLDGIQEN
jgi:outer membrane protein OmpA-like peptidoglycan-associated protein